ncbi:response regulator [Candidatus Poribacteria bacterium]|nr:response regulator [Candidatus Poribacteria bacterium]
MKSKKVLIVEDEKETVDLLRALFDGVAYQYDFAENQSEALRKIKEWRPDVMLLDLRIPRDAQSGAIDKANGAQLVREANSLIDGLKIIVMTGDTHDYLDNLLVQEPYIYHGFTKETLDFDQIQKVIEEALAASGG